MNNRTAIGILFGISAAAAGAYASRIISNDYRRFQQEQRDARELNGAYLARHSEISFFPRRMIAQRQSLETSYRA